MSLSCCHAPAFAHTKIMPEEVRSTSTVREMVAADVRGLLFPVVYRYDERDRTEFTWGRRVMHDWIDTDSGERVAMWHWATGLEGGTDE